MSVVDAEDLIARLSGGLSPADRTAFRKAAEAALATQPECWGEGSAYRAITRLWRQYFRPPRAGDFGWGCEKKQQNKLIVEGPQDSRAHHRARGLRIVG